MTTTRTVRLLALAAAGACLAGASPALAHDPVPPGADTRPEWHGGPQMPPMPERDAWERRRSEWLADCRAQFSRHDDGLGGVLIGGVTGGVIGNVVAGKGNRTAGTVIGATVGAIAGAAIDKAEDSGRERDYCERYLDYYSHAGAYGGYGYGYGYAMPMMMVPVMAMHSGHMAKGKECTETVVTEEWVEVPVVRREKRVRIITEKRVPVAPGKRVAAPPPGKRVRGN